MRSWRECQIMPEFLPDYMRGKFKKTANTSLYQQRTAGPAELSGAGWVVGKEAHPGDPRQLSRWREDGGPEKDLAACPSTVEWRAMQ